MFLTSYLVDLEESKIGISGKWLNVKNESICRPKKLAQKTNLILGH